ncbi:hypothetical protein CQA53_00480 [Helicobacter didelphidarum]|uniref:Uncharacterized protein n=1 Tax=Helicobacter didelphidarum TaxID=2040648 RepID=A0A3D8IRC7_9HELI|nr:hypothetical protein [Helicobacter didelphidarum]RDU67530.1 hypothetical protein CQA53_00480 [Helicobacter didelphidarum]
MDIYAIVVYALFCTAFTLTIISFARIAGLFTINTTLKAGLAIFIFIICLIHFGKYSIARLLYSLFDIPSFLLALVCILSIIRSFVNQIGIIISYKGMIFLFFAWILFACNTFGIFEWSYGSTNYKILIIGIFIAVGYCTDRVCGILMLCVFLLWMIFSSSIDIYHAMFDVLVCGLCVCIQSMPMSWENFHVALLKPHIPRH